MKEIEVKLTRDEIRLILQLTEIVNTTPIFCRKKDIALAQSIDKKLVNLGY